MRNIKFRAWVKQQKRMVDVDIINFRKNELSFAENIGNWQVGGCWFPIETVELMQYTGLHDKNGKEIYEGDIIKCHDIIALKVEYDEDGSFIGVNYKSGDKLLIYQKYLIDFKYEVIGNIYDTNLEEL